MLGQAQSLSNKLNIRTEEGQKNHGSLPFLGRADVLRRIARRDEAGSAAAGEQALYNWIGSEFDAAEKDPDTVNGNR